MKMIKTLLMLTVCTVCSAKITEVGTMDAVFAHFADADAGTLAVFDVDMVLIQPGDPAFQMANMKKYGSICKKVMGQIPADKRNIFLALMSLSQPVLIDRRMPEFIQGLAEKGVPKVALTANLTGPLKSIERLERHRVASLQNLGIDFSSGAPYTDDILFNDLPTYRNNFSLYTSGIIFVNGTVCTKGDLLTAFFEKSKSMPRRVIFVDDREDNLKDVAASLQRFNPTIEYVGLHYVGAKDYPSESISETDFETRWTELSLEAQKL